MSKRQIEVQGTKDGTSFQGDGSASANAEDVPKRATAAQLANRKLRSIKQPLSRKQTSGSQSHNQGGVSQPNPFAQAQLGTPSSAFGSQQQNAPQQPSPFGLQQPQQQDGGIFGGATSSFPPAQSATPSSSFVNSSFPAFGAGANANVNTGFSFNPTPPTASGFNFSAGGPNPFAATNTADALKTPVSAGFSGSIFNLAPPQPAATPAKNTATPSNAQALAAPFSFGATGASSAPSPSIFGQTTQTLGTNGASSSIFGTSTTPNTNIFGQGNAPTTPFSSSLEKVSSPDAMQTSPDYSPSKPTSPAATTSQPLGTSLFERITPADPKPQDTPRQSVETPPAEQPSQPPFAGFGQTPAANKAPIAGNPFANIARTPSPAKEVAPPRPAEESKPTNPFSKMHPLDKPGQSSPSPALSQSSNIFGQQPASNIFGQKPVPTPSASISKSSEPVASPSKQPQPPSAATKTPSFAPNPTGPPILGLPSSSFAPPKSSPLKFSTPVDVTPPSSKRSAVMEQLTISSTSTANVFGSSQGQPMFSAPPSTNKSTSDGTTDAVGYDPVTGKVTSLDVRKATLADLEKAIGDGPDPNADDLSKEIWCQREKLRILNRGFKDSINRAGAYADLTRYTVWYTEVGQEISTLLVAARRKKAAIDEANSGPMNPSVKRKADHKGEGQQEGSGSVAKKSKSVEKTSAPQKTVSQTAQSLEDVLSGRSAAPSPRPASNPPSVSETSKSLENILNGGSAAPSPRPGLTQPSNSPFTSTPAAPANLFSGSASTAAGSSRLSNQSANNRADFAASAPKFPPASTSGGSNQSPFNPFNPQNKSPAPSFFSSEAASNSFTPVSKNPVSNPFDSASTTSKAPLANPFGSVSKAPASNLFNPAPSSAPKEPVASNAFTSSSKEPTSDIGSSNSLFQKPTNATETPTPSSKPSTTFSGGNPPATAPPAFSVKLLPAGTTNGIQMPKFSLGSGTPNFMQQFAKNALSAEEILAEEKKKAMRDLPDPDDSDYEEELAEFEEKWEKEQNEKRAKKAAASSTAPVFQFTPSGSNASSDSEAAPKATFSLARPSSAASSNGLFVSRNNSPTPSTNGGTSVFDTPAAQSTPFANIFGHLSGGESGADAAGEDDDEEEETEGSDDQDPNDSTPVVAQQTSTKRKEVDEQSEEDVLEETMRRKRQDRTPQAEKQIESTQAPVQSKGKSIFDRINHGPDGQPERELPTPESGKANGASETPKATMFGSSLFQPNTSLSGDQTFNREGPIKFSSTAPAPFSFTATSPANGKNLFANLTPSTLAPSNAAPAQSLLAPPGTAFGLPSGFNSPFMSRAATPFSADEASGKESGDASGKTQDEDKLTDAQLQLTDLTETEKRENDVLFECDKSKALEHDRGSKNPGGSWENRGLGPVRILKNKQTGVVSLLQRQSPGGRIVVNVRILPGIPATGAGKSIKVPVPSSGDRPATWCFRFGTEESAADFMKTWNENKPS